MDEEKNENVEENTEENSEENREEETIDEIRDEDYSNDDEIEMDRSIEKRLDGIEAKMTSILDTLSMFVDSGAIIRESNVTDNDFTEEDFGEDFTDIDDLDFSI